MVKVMLVLFQIFKRNLIFFMLLICVALFLSCSSSRADVVESEDPSDVDGSSIAVQISGIISDPYIAGATVCCDSNSNDQCDNDEVSVISDIEFKLFISSFTAISKIPPISVHEVIKSIVDKRYKSLINCVFLI